MSEIALRHLVIEEFFADQNPTKSLIDMMELVVATDIAIVESSERTKDYVSILAGWIPFFNALFNAKKDSEIKDMSKTKLLDRRESYDSLRARIVNTYTRTQDLKFSSLLKKYLVHDRNRLLDQNSRSFVRTMADFGIRCVFSRFCSQPDKSVVDNGSFKI